MNKEENKPIKDQTEADRIKLKEDITAASIKNAHATGDGAVQKSDELFLKEADNKTSSDTNPY